MRSERRPKVRRHTNFGGPERSQPGRGGNILRIPKVQTNALY